MPKLAVIGPGLLGGSIALALRAHPEWSVAIWARRPEAVAELRQKSVAPLASTDLAEVAEEADLAVLCVPIGAMAGLAAQLSALSRPPKFITDVGSVKEAVCEALTPAFTPPSFFVGSHPMAGSEQAGLAAARADLFAGSVCIVTPEPATPPEALEAVTHLWQILGCQVRQLSPAEHDRTVAFISHTPHLLAAALVNAVGAAHPEATTYAGPGFRDSTRIAAGPAGMWAEILRTNAPAVRRSTEAVIEKLQEFLTMLDGVPADCEPLMMQFLDEARARRERLRPLPPRL